jgi:hypothetical protein
VDKVVGLTGLENLMESDYLGDQNTDQIFIGMVIRM